MGGREPGAAALAPHVLRACNAPISGSAKTYTAVNGSLSKLGARGAWLAGRDLGE